MKQQTGQPYEVFSFVQLLLFFRIFTNSARAYNTYAIITGKKGGGHG